jgi:hypothetical protein
MSLTRLYTWIASVILFLQGASTLTALMVPAFDRAFPALLQNTQMVPVHSALHIASALIGFVALRYGPAGTRAFAIGFGLFYAGLGVLGYGSGHGMGLELKPFDHPFHIVLGGAGLVAAAIEMVRARAA